MKDPDSNGGRGNSVTRRRRNQLAQLSPDSQGEFFAPPAVSTTIRVTAQPLTTEIATSTAEIDLTPDPELTVDQAEALRSIEAAYEPGGFYLLTGHAGSGKTYLMQRLTKSMLAKNRRVVLSAPTHKAVAVLALKLTEANIKDVPCRTIHSVLSLTPKPRADRLVFERDRDAEPVKPIWWSLTNVP
jgi:predicted ATP-dependent serine protease